MKKQLIIAFVLSLCTVSGAFATVLNTSTTIGNGTYTPSNKVGLNIISTATSYAATSAHLSGTFQYGTVGGAGVTGDPSKIQKKAIPSQAGLTVGTPEPPASATALTGTWTD